MSQTPAWNPIVREGFELDFEDWLTREIDTAYIIMIPDALQNGDDTSAFWFLQQAENANLEDDKCLEDFWLRKAAQRGSWVAMQYLADYRYELGHLNEAMRWNFRLTDALLDNASNLSGLNPKPTPEEWRTDLETAIENIAFLSSEGIAVGDGVSTNNPKDLGKKRHYPSLTYCLKCGSLKYESAAIDQCDGSVHVSLRNFGG